MLNALYSGLGYIGTAVLKLGGESWVNISGEYINTDLVVMALSIFATISAVDDVVSAWRAGRWYDITLATLQLVATAGACVAVIVGIIAEGVAFFYASSAAAGVAAVCGMVGAGEDLTVS